MYRYMYVCTYNCIVHNPEGGMLLAMSASKGQMEDSNCSKMEPPWPHPSEISGF